MFVGYALRSVCAVLLYSLLDDDKSATIDTTEMFCVLREMFCEFMDESQIVALTDYLMTTVGQQQGTVRATRLGCQKGWSLYCAMPSSQMHRARACKRIECSSSIVVFRTDQARCRHAACGHDQHQ